MPRSIGSASLASLLGSLLLAGCANGVADGAPIGSSGGSSGVGPGPGTGNVGVGLGGGGIIIIETCGNFTEDAGEECDDGNRQANDGCSPACTVEVGWVCPTFGLACVSVPECGDGAVAPSEACDDGNQEPGDGCSADCSLVEAGWQCRVPNKACVPLCGDGILTDFENCEDGNAVSGDGCSSSCLTEPGYDCSTGVCIKSICGNGIPEKGETCDKGAENGLFYGDGSGCSKTCTLEPTCRDGSGNTGACQTYCGDGNIDTASGEACDDGNAVSGDGCSELCQIEPGFDCTVNTATDEQPCSSGTGSCLVLPVILRDFEGQQVTGGHPDFFYLGATAGGNKTICVPNASGTPVAGPFSSGQECSNSDATGPCTGLVAPTLNAQGKPTLAGASGVCPCRFTEWDSNTILAGVEDVGNCSGGAAGNKLRVGYETPLNVTMMQSQESFAQWYADSTYSTAIRGALDLAPIGGGQYQFSSGTTINDDIHAACRTGGTTGTLSSGFFPLEDQPRAKICNLWPYWVADGGECCAGAGTCALPSQWDPSLAYGTCDPGTTGGPVPPDGQGSLTGMRRNFYFTSEVRYLFRYDGVGGTLAFFGDDDVWVFVNGQLALDLGATHERLQGQVAINGATFGLEEGRIYEIAVFHADRHPRDSNYQLTLSGFGTQFSTCMPECGDAVVASGEECDLGVALNTGEYGGCTADCKYGPFCGDGLVDPVYEQCDAGRDNGPAYTNVAGACSTGCFWASYCGDRVHDALFGEECDDGPEGSATCTSECVYSPR